MTAAQMADCIAFLSVVDPNAAERVRYAGKAGYAWPFNASEFYTRGYSRETMAAFANASALASCELQCVLEAFRAERQGGVMIGAK